MTAIPTSFPLIKRLTTYIKWYRLQNNVACLLDCQAVWSLANVSPFLLFLQSHPQLGSSHLWNNANIFKKKKVNKPSLWKDTCSILLVPSDFISTDQSIIQTFQWIAFPSISSHFVKTISSTSLPWELGCLFDHKPNKNCNRKHLTRQLKW